jgi:2-desacetyl-2-hydroxyethyl bacteriochlorophyllide A dehydrogenase
MRAAQWLEPHRIEVTDVEEPSAASGQAIVEVATCGICGSDLHSYERGFAATPGQVLGHEFCGRVVSAPDVDGISEGDRVTVRPLIPCGECDRCLDGDVHLCEAGHGMNIGYGTRGAFAERVLVPKAISGQTIFRLPESIDDRAGALVEPLSVAMRAVNIADPHPDDVVLVLGAGPIGLGAAALTALRGVRTLVVSDPSPGRRERAEAVGADRTIDPLNESTVDVMRSITGPGGFGLGARADVVIDCAGSPAGFMEGLKSVRHGGKMSLAAMYSGKVELRLDRVVEKELKVLGSFAYKDEFNQVIDLLASGAIKPDDFITHEFDLNDIGAAFKKQLERETSLKVLVHP